MKKLLLTTVVTIVGLLNVTHSNIAIAADYNIDVCAVQAYDGANSDGLLKPCSPWTSQASCSNTWISFALGTEQGRLMYKTATLAQITDRQITVRVSSAIGCLNNYDRTIMIRLN